VSYQTLQLADGSYQITDTVTGNVVFYADASTVMTGKKIGSIARTDTTAKNLFTLPANTVVIGLKLISGVASNATTTATVSVGITGTNTYFISGADVKTAAGQLSAAAATNVGTNVGTSAVQVVGIYAETGTASTTGGPFLVVMDYYFI